jgi:hypothetical protein
VTIALVVGDRHEGGLLTKPSFSATFMKASRDHHDGIGPLPRWLRGTIA